MAEMDNTTSGIIWQWLAEHKQDVLDYFATIMREASDIQLVNFDADRHMGLLATFVYQGVRRVDNVKPSSLVEGLTRLNEELSRRCEAAAAEAERQGTYARTQGDRVDECISGYQALYTRVKNQGDTAEQQGANAQSIYESVNAWYAPFKANAENWYSDTVGIWDDWYAARLAQWLSWYTNGIVPTWNGFWSGVQADWQDWTEKETARQQAELERIAKELIRRANEETRQQNEDERLRNESTRQSQEQTRQTNENAREQAEELRQQTFEANEIQRQQDFEDAEDERMETMLVTELYVDYDDMSLNVIQPESSDVDYELEDAILYMLIPYEEVES